MQEKNEALPAIQCSSPNARGKVTITARFLQGGQWHEIKIPAGRKALLALASLEGPRREIMLHNIFAYPVAHQVVQEHPRHGKHADRNRIEFMGTAREIEPMFSAWLKMARPGDPVRKLVVRELNKRKGSKIDPSDDQIITFLIEQNWSNIKRRSFPDKPPTQTPRFLRSVRGKPIGILADGYMLARSWNGSRLNPGVYPERISLPTEERGRLLAAGILDGGWLIRQITQVTFDIPL